MIHAADLVGREALEREQDGPRVAGQLDGYTRLYQQTGGGSIPKLIIGKHVISGEATGAEEVFGLLEQLLHIRQSEP